MYNGSFRIELEALLSSSLSAVGNLTTRQRQLEWTDSVYTGINLTVGVNGERYFNDLTNCSYGISDVAGTAVFGFNDLVLDSVINWLGTGWLV